VTTPKCQSENWATLFRIACSLIRQANANGASIDHWTFGGGTAMMVQIDHRESRDIDIFLSDAQNLSFLDPKTNDFDFEFEPTAYQGDGARFLKFVFEDIGEIDFIVAGPLTKTPTTPAQVEGETVQLETIPEVIAKKIHYRGSSISPRDIFDIAASGEAHSDSIIRELKSHKNAVTIALAAMERLTPSFVSDTIAQLAIKPKYEPIAKTALERAKAILLAV